MYKYVVAVLTNTADPDEVISANTISVPKGENLTLEVQVLNSDGFEVDLTGKSVAFRLADFNLAPIYNVSGSDGSRTGRIVLSVNLPAYLPSGTYSWDLWMSVGSAKYQIKPMGAFKLLNSTYSLN